jgi:uncharacterized protein YjbJ (UPF0337 family)
MHAGSRRWCELNPLNDLLLIDRVAPDRSSRSFTDTPVLETSTKKACKAHARHGARSQLPLIPGHASCRAIQRLRMPAIHSVGKEKEQVMNWDRVEGNWLQLKGKVKEQWGKLTDDQIDQIAGRRDRLVGLVQEKYGLARDKAEREVDGWLSKLN